MEQTALPEIYDLLILVDATASMSSYLRSLRQSLPQIISISALTDCFERIGVLAYRDYDLRADELLEWSGWLSTADLDEDQPDLIGSTGRLDAFGGGDWDEAAKTGLARAYQLMREDATTLVLFYTDAPPHMMSADRTNPMQEQKALLEQQTYGPNGACFADWAMAAHTLAESTKRAHIISIVDRGIGRGDDWWYWFLSEITGGAAIILQDTKPRDISEITIESLLSWMGVRKQGAESGTMPAQLVRFTRVGDSWLTSRKAPDIRTIRDETDLTSGEMWERALRVSPGLTRTILDNYLPRKKTALPNFAEKYKTDEKYRTVVTAHLRDIIIQDVTAISLNPVFGSLWRVFCSDRKNEHREELLHEFGRRVEAIQGHDERAKMNEWLIESYDYTADVLETVSKVPVSQRFPCVCLDPTLVFTNSARANRDEEDDDDEEDQPITAFTRSELLEIGRSCDQRILRRLGRVLTSLTFIKSADEMPAHIAATGNEEVLKIPMALASKENHRRFWRILLHIVVPGTMLSARPAALLAALSICLGITPLIEAAEEEMMSQRAHWNNTKYPETWDSSCLSLLLDADDQYQSRVEKDGGQTLGADEGLLLSKDRAIFKTLLEYKILERNLDTTLTARVRWCPKRVTMPIGPVTMCNSCKLPRSVTIMGPDNVCGLCLVPQETTEAQEKALRARVRESDNADSDAVWYECNVPACRGQYVVYNVENLKSSPKCHFCRNEEATANNGKKSSTPWVECVKCLSRMIWPLEYRAGEDFTAWECIACLSGKKTIVDVKVTANQLRAENGQEWLLGNRDQKLAEPFRNRSLFHMASNASPLRDLCERVIILPGMSDPQLQLFRRSELIRNTPDLLHQLSDWVRRRCVQTDACSLCVRERQRADLRPACGRSGCQQRICQPCLAGWYGLNAPGCIINTAALNCPFCRRAPTAKTLAAHGMGIHAVGDLREAVERRGEWIYAWCRDCGYARPYMERVCADGAPPDLRDWTCEACEEKKTELVMEKVKDCPGCGISTEKISGCDHIMCRCGAHWCFHCGEQHDEETIYQHMGEVHGGFYHGIDHDVDSDLDDDDYD